MPGHFEPDHTCDNKTYSFLHQRNIVEQRGGPGDNIQLHGLSVPFDDQVLRLLNIAPILHRMIQMGLHPVDLQDPVPHFKAHLNAVPVLVQRLDLPFLTAILFNPYAQIGVFDD
ncbi:hypothetical protein D3C75_1130210 [compost metagenome]